MPGGASDLPPLVTANGRAAGYRAAAAGVIWGWSLGDAGRLEEAGHLAGVDGVQLAVGAAPDDADQAAVVGAVQAAAGVAADRRGVGDRRTVARVAGHPGAAGGSGWWPGGALPGCLDAAAGPPVHGWPGAPA